ARRTVARVTTSALVAVLALGACSSQSDDDFEPGGTRTVSAAPTPTGTITPQSPDERQAGEPPELAGTRPDIVKILMDDFSMDLLSTMAAGQRLAERGATFDHFVVDSLCCVSRASLMTGQYPHQTGVLTNAAQSDPGEGPMGGYAA